MIEQGRLEIFMLKNIQSKFKDAVISGKEEDFLPEIEEGGKIGPKQRLFIYSHAYKARLIETLEEDFSVLHSLVGDDMFNDICLKYIDDFPSKHPSLRYFGQHMPVFLKNSNDFSNLIPAIEMAEYEWTFNDVFDAVDKNAIKFDDVATIAPDAWTTLRFNYNRHVIFIITNGIRRPFGQRLQIKRKSFRSPKNFLRIFFVFNGKMISIVFSERCLMMKPEP